MNRHIKKVDLSKEMAKRVNIKGLPIVDMKKVNTQNNNQNQPDEGQW